MAPKTIIGHVRPGMTVHTWDGQPLGTVVEVWSGSDPTAQDPQSDEAVCSRLEVYHGGRVLQVLYVPCSALATVAAGQVTLNVDAATVHERDWGTAPPWIAAADTGRPRKAPDDLGRAPGPP